MRDNLPSIESEHANDETHPGYRDFGVAACKVMITVAILLLGGASVEIGDVFYSKKRLRAATDAATLAAAQKLPDGDAARAAAIALIEQNLPPEMYGTIVTANDVHLGNWDGKSGTFMQDTGTPCAVRVVARHSNEGGYGGAIESTLLNFVAFEGWSIKAEATAVQAATCGRMSIVGALAGEEDDTHKRPAAAGDTKATARDLNGEVIANGLPTGGRTLADAP